MKSIIEEMNARLEMLREQDIKVEAVEVTASCCGRADGSWR